MMLMPDTILVTYASRQGATAEVAEAIGRAIAESGAAVEVRPMKEVTDLSPYGAVVAGSAIQHCEWLPEAVKFVQTHQRELNQKPFAAFLVCITLAMRDAATLEKSRPGISEWFAPIRALVQPVSEAQFAGTLYLNKIPGLIDRLGFGVSIKAGVWSEGDFRDWAAIHDWGASLPAQLVH